MRVDRCSHATGAGCRCSFAYIRATHAEIVATLTLMRWMREFIRQTACERANNPLNPHARYDGDTITRDRAARMLRAMVHVAINRKAGIADAGGIGRYYPTDLHPVNGFGMSAVELERDARAVRDHVQHRIRVYQLETPLFKKRYAHILSERGE